MTSFAQKLNSLIGGTNTPQAVIAKPKAVPKPTMTERPIMKNNYTGATKQSSDYGKAMNKAVKSTKVFS